jgi:hypothetical protein
MGRAWWAWGLIAYGILGLVLALVGVTFGMEAGGRIERLAAASDGTLAAAARSTRAAADSFASVDTSLGDAEESAGQAATLAAEASATLDALSAAMNLSIFGSQPLAPLADEFSTSADQAEELAGTLSNVGGSLSDTRADAAVIGVELAGLGEELDALREATPTDPIPVRGLVALLVAWLALPAVGALIAGLTLLRASRRAAPPPA